MAARDIINRIGNINASVDTINNNIIIVSGLTERINNITSQIRDKFARLNQRISELERELNTAQNTGDDSTINNCQQELNAINTQLVNLESNIASILNESNDIPTLRDAISRLEQSINSDRDIAEQEASNRAQQYRSQDAVQQEEQSPEPQLPPIPPTSTGGKKKRIHKGKKTLKKYSKSKSKSKKYSKSKSKVKGGWKGPHSPNKKNTKKKAAKRK